jgi:hypothetical protein
VREINFEIFKPMYIFLKNTFLCNIFKQLINNLNNNLFKR